MAAQPTTPYPPIDGLGPGMNSESSSLTDDDLELKALGYMPSFKREFSNLATVRGRICDFRYQRWLMGMFRSASRSASCKECDLA